MNTEYEKQLEVRIRRELDALGELEAPPEITRRVMRIVEQRAAGPWYRRSWTAWPIGLRAGYLAALCAAFMLLCFGASQLVHFAALTPAGHEVSGWFGLAGAVWHAVNVLASAIGLAFQSLGPTVIIGGVALLVFSYATCLGLGTIYWRLAFAPLKERQL